jgi:hypothetical protein
MRQERFDSLAKLVVGAARVGEERRTSGRVLCEYGAVEQGNLSPTFRIHFRL